ncbi:MAG: DNA replication and repair protein RecF [Acidobacteria bacterium]|nr:DNA replication and repair protein RecF [Acidobacteriota bacterium]
MQLTRIEAYGFRNLEGFVETSAGLNIFYGDNAQGKTNWLEAIYVLGSSKSFRTNQVRDCLNFNTHEARIRGEVLRGTLRKQLQLFLNDTTKQLFINGKREAVTRYLGNLDVFVFSLEEMDVIRGDPTSRRRFLDRGVATLMPSFIGTLAKYNHLLKQKNRLLAEASQSKAPETFYPQVEVWNDQLVEAGTVIHKARVRYIERLNQTLDENDHGRAIFGAERINLRYKSHLEGKGDLDQYRQLFRERLEVRLAAEVASGHALLGPHRDDLEILADGREVARFGSAGQQRSALILLDLAQVSIYNFTYEESPVLLIDDIDAELDRGRIEALLVVLEGNAQTFISTSRRSIANRYRDRAAVYWVEQGQAVNEPSSVSRLASQDPENSADELARAVRERVDQEESEDLGMQAE